ncbi:MAG TPA: hypothetical protein VGD13_14330 [Xanthobacteraceae bacterium]
MRQVPLIVSVAAMVAAIAGCGFAGDSDEKVVSASGQFPTPRMPEIRDATTVAEALPSARALAANKSSFLGRGLGELKAGDKAILVTTTTDPHADIYIAAIVQALKERNVTAILMHDYEIVGVTKEQARELDDFRRSSGLYQTSEQGWAEGCNLFLTRTGDRGADRGYLKSARPDLYEKCNPPILEEQLPAELKAVYAKMQTARRVIPGHVNAYMDKNPDIRGVFYGRGGPLWMSFHPHEGRWMGPFVLDNKFEVMAPVAEFPADVWMLAEELTMEALPSADKVTVTDPEGTDVWWNLTETQAKAWAKGVYLRGHLFMFPQEAYGQYALSVLNYPAMDPEYIPVDDNVLINGTVAATTSHAGFYPRMVQTWKDGYLTDVKGGGTYGEFLRTLMKQPGIHDTVWPQRKKPGYFQFFETALGTNPKISRQNLNANWGVAMERARDGVIHWALGAIYWNDPGSMGGESSVSGKLAQFNRSTGHPGGHGFHMHTYFNTMKLHLRGSNKWVTLVDRGRSTSLDSPEVRSLASRYGDPDKILATEWVPDIPGVNAPGSYEQDYAPNPFKHAQAVVTRNRASPGMKKPAAILP